MVNSLLATHGAAALAHKNVPKKLETLAQSLMDRLYEVLRHWERLNGTGPGLRTSLAYLFTMKGMYQRQDTCPKPPQKMIHRIVCIVYKNGLPMTDEVFGLPEPTASSKRKRTPRQVGHKP